MTEAFPQMAPTTRSFTMGDYPSKTYTSLSGAVFKRAFGNKATNYRLDLTFKNIADTVQVRNGSGTVKEIVDHFRTVTDGTFKSFTLPLQVFAGLYSDASSKQNRIIDNLNPTIRRPDSISWRYAEPPEVQSVKSGMSTVTVKLIGEIDA
jgi:hypothetical protein